MITIHVSPKHSDNAMHIASLLLKKGEPVIIVPTKRTLMQNILETLETEIPDAEIKTLGKAIMLTPRGEDYAVDAI